MSEDYKRPELSILNQLADIATQLRMHSVRMTQASDSGHPTSCASIAEVMSVLFFQAMRFHVQEPRHPANDRFVLSKGHAAPILYAAWAEAGLLQREDLLKLRKIDSDLEGHPTPRLNFVDVASGSLGQGLSCSAGMAWVGKYLDKADYRVYCVVGDGECAEGSVWEAMSFASHYKLDNLVVIFDINRLGQSEPTSLQHDFDTYVNRAKAFGWHVILVDGHDVGELCDAFAEAAVTRGQPTCVLAKTFKGRGFSNIENLENWHGKPLGNQAERVLAELAGQLHEPGLHRLCPKLPLHDVVAIDDNVLRLAEPPAYSLGQKVATRAAYGTALAKMGRANPRVIGMDGDTKNSTFSIKLKEACPDRFIECFIAEQNLVGVGIGSATRGRAVPFVSSFAAFFSRAYDQLRMGAISQSNVNICGSHAGISIGEDGPSQMALEDLAMFRAIPNCTVFYPSDAVSCERAVELAANTKGICFIRTGRPDQAVIYSNDEVFSVGQAKIVRQSSNDQVLLIGAGITLSESLKAADILAQKGISVRVLDPFTIKPLDSKSVCLAAAACGGRVVVTEDHYPEGGLGEAVAGALSEHATSSFKLRRLAVNGLPRSGKPAELMSLFKIDAEAIAAAALQLANA